MSNNRYSMSLGYANAGLPLIRGALGYKRNNGFLAPQYAPDAPGSQIVAITFSAAPANGSTLQVVDTDVNGAPTTKLFTYTYSGSPGAGIIPLVAGGGTAAQAATATQVALAAQLNTWSVTNTVVNRTTLASLVPGRNVAVPFGGTQLTGVFTANPAINTNCLPATSGPLPATMPFL